MSDSEVRSCVNEWFQALLSLFVKLSCKTFSPFSQSCGLNFKNIFAMGDLGRQGWSTRGYLLNLRSLLCLLVRKNTMM